MGSIDNGTYIFKNSHGQTVSAPTVGTDCTGWTYTVSGASKDKYYVGDICITSGEWGHYDTLIEASGTAIGTGKSNTALALSITHTDWQAYISTGTFMG